MAVASAIVAGVGMAASAVSGAVAANKAKKAAKGARKDKMAAEAELQAVKNARQDIINPYDTTKNLSDLAQDLSGQMTNPFQQLGVATQAAEIQMEQTDIALANTLDTLRATGASAGGATALAQAELLLLRKQLYKLRKVLRLI
jgi:succinate dehydrogenase/fumarate reductase flavoprotein subunit